VRLQTQGDCVHKTGVNVTRACEDALPRRQQSSRRGVRGTCMIASYHVNVSVVGFKLNEEHCKDPIPPRQPAASPPVCPAAARTSSTYTLQYTASCRSVHLPSTPPPSMGSVEEPEGEVRPRSDNTEAEVAGEAVPGRWQQRGTPVGWDTSQLKGK
jgi:hypothetical protein